MPTKAMKWFGLIVITTFIFSCAPTKRAAYFRKHETVKDLNMPDKVYQIKQDTAEYIRRGDELYITVTSGNDEPTGFEGTGAASLGVELISYEVDNNGDIRLPYLREYNVAGMSIDELANSLEDDLSEYIYLPSVSVRIVNKQIIVLGEVGAPGAYVFNRRDINIYEVLAHAGDIAPFGNRKNLLIVRTEDNKVKKKHIDLTNDEIIGSEWYEVQANDIIYVEPLTRRMFGTETFSVFDIFGLITGSVSVYLLITGLD